MEMDIVISPGRLRPVIENGRVKQRAAFINKQSDQKEMASEIVRSDCLNKGYRIIKGLGSGAYAKVKLAEVSVSKLARHTSMADYLDTGNLQVAVKVIQKKIVPQEFLKKFLPRELDNHSVLPAHPYVVRCFEHFSTSDFTYLIMEYVCNGDLLDMINQTISKNERGLGEDISKKFFRQIALGLRHIHQNGIVHRDMKCENILIDGNSDVKITDFGFSCKYNDRNTLLKTSCGSYAYTAPEVIKNIPYDGTLCDIWSLGIILCGMVNGRLPYNDGHLSEMDEDMRMQTIRFEHNVPLDCMVLVRKLLQYNCLMRPTIEEILSDPWLTGNTPIPRHMHKSKWANSYSINIHDEIGKENVKLKVDGANSRNNASIYYRAVSPEKIKANGTESVVLNTAVRETIILKSRQLSNAYREISPRNERRPKTWPKSVREQAEKIKSDVRSLSEYKHINERIRQLMNVTKDRARAKLVKKVNKKGATKPCDYTPLMYMYKYLQPDGQIQQRSPSPPMSPKHKTKLVTTHILPAANKPSPTKFVSIRGPETHQHKVSSRMPTVDSHCKQRMMIRKKRIALAKLVDLENTDVPDLDMIDLNMVSEKEKIPPEGRIKSVPARGNRQSGLGLSSERQTPAERAKSCRERFVQIYSKKKTGIPGQKIPIPSLMVQKHENDGELELGLGIRAPYSIQGRSRSTSPEKHSVKTIYKYKYH